MPDAVSVRDARPEDMDALREIYFAARRNEFPWEKAPAPEDFDAHTAGEKIMTAVYGGRPAGFVSVWEEDRFIHCLFVSRGARRLGAGGALLGAAEARYGRPMTLKCMSGNAAALEFYRRRGWRAAGAGECAEGTYVLMKLE